jgi:tripartite-type tricarboxylate transporter receptor subunit TctC
MWRSICCPLHPPPRAAPDGYTLLLHNLQISANVALYPRLGFDTERDLLPVGFINQNPLVLTGRKSLPANTHKLEILYWHALFVPGGTPAPVIDKLNEALQQVEEPSAIVDS